MIVRANTPQVRSVQTGGVVPRGVEGFGAVNGPPVKLRLGVEGDTVPLDGVVVAHVVADINNSVPISSIPQSPSRMVISTPWSAPTVFPVRLLACVYSQRA